MRSIAQITVFASLLVVAGACGELTVPDLNNPGLDELQENPTRGSVIAASTGLLVGTREEVAEPNGYISLLGIIGRESYNFDAADPRYVTQMMIGPLDGGTPAFGGNLWIDSYANIRGANIILNALDAVSDMSDDEKEGTRGFAKTIQALDFLVVINSRNEFGAAIAVDIEPTGEPGPLVSKDEVFAHIVQLLDEAKTHLEAGGSDFPFPLSGGFVGFDTPESFLTFNRALKARVDVYMGNYTQALTSLGESFLTAALDVATLELGAYHEYTTGSGDQVNQLFDPEGAALVAHPSIETDAQLQADGVTPDDRFVRKTFRLAAPATDQASQGISTDLGMHVYAEVTAPVPIIRNEELILLRAEANLALGNDAAALADINMIRAVSGGLSAIAAGAWQALSNDAQLDELLYNKRYSLLWEGHRWIDMRRYDRLDQLPRDATGHTVFVSFPFPVAECQARVPAPSQGCTLVPGIP